MKDIKIIVTKKVASVEGTPIIVCGNSDYTLSFTFDDEWKNEQNKVARFSFTKNGLKSFIDMPITDNTCQVPVLIGIGLVRVGVYAGDLKTTTGAKIKCHKSILCDDADTMDEPFKNLYDELLEKIENIENSGGGSSGDGFEILGEVKPTEEHTNEQVYGAKALDETFVAIDILFQDVTEHKQDELVSGENIKTINGVSILGEGNITVGGGAEVPENVETTDNKVTTIDENSTDEQYASAKATYDEIQEQTTNKQDKLVSGQNVKTINGQSILGSGNLEVSGGGSGGESSSKVFERIATVTVDPDEDGSLPTKISITADDNGNPFELTDIYCEVLMGLTDGTAGRFYIQADKVSLFGNATLSFTNTALRKWFFRYDSFGEGLGGLVSAPNGSISAGTDFPSTNINTLFGQPIPVGMTLNIKSLNFVGQVGDTKTFMEGTTITLWGVRK